MCVGPVIKPVPFLCGKNPSSNVQNGNLGVPVEPLHELVQQISLAFADRFFGEELGI
jgi:hypothetical protein